MAKKSVKSVWPVYAPAVVMLVCAAFVPMLTVLDFIVVIGLSVLSYFVAKLIFKDKLVEAPDFENTDDKKVNAVLDSGRRFIEQMIAAKAQIKKTAPVLNIIEIIAASEKIYAFLSKNPGSIKLVAEFSDYYVPQTEKLVKSYIELTRIHSEDKDILGTISKIEAALPMIENAFEHQLDNLYKDRTLDLRTDLKVFENIMSEKGVETK